MKLQSSGVPLRVGVVGAGLIGRRRVRIARQSSATIPVVVADIDRGRAEDVAREVECQATSDWQEVVERDDGDIVVVATTNNSLAPISIAAMQHGIAEIAINLHHQPEAITGYWMSEHETLWWIDTPEDLYRVQAIWEKGERR